MSPDPDIALVRAGIRIHPDEPTDVMVGLESEALAALDRLEARIEELEAAKADLFESYRGAFNNRLAAEARIAELERERESLKVEVIDWKLAKADSDRERDAFLLAELKQQDRAEAAERERGNLKQAYDMIAPRAVDAEARAERYAEALRRIDYGIEVDWALGVDENCERLREVARAVLADQPPAENTCICGSSNSPELAGPTHARECPKWSTGQEAARGPAENTDFEWKADVGTTRPALDRRHT